MTGEVCPIAVVSDNGPVFKATGFERFIASRPELIHIRTKRQSPQQNGVRERAFGSLKYEHLYRLAIPDGPTLAGEVEAYRQSFNWIRLHEALDMRDRWTCTWRPQPGPRHQHKTSPKPCHLPEAGHNDPRNLWVEPPSPGHTPSLTYPNPKDGVERKVKSLVCNGRVSLAVMQR